MLEKLFHKKPNNWEMIVVFIASTVGLIASFVLSQEALILASNADAVLDCSLNAVINCATVASHWSATIFGFPSSFIGMVTMPVVMTISMSVLAGAKYPKWFMRATQAGVVAGLFFALWMLYMSFAVIGVFCPWCLLFDAMMIIMFFGVTRYNVLGDYCIGNKTQAKQIKSWFNKKYDIVVMISLITVIILMIIGKYGAELFS